MKEAEPPDQEKLLLLRRVLRVPDAALLPLPTLTAGFPLPSLPPSPPLRYFEFCDTFPSETRRYLYFHFLCVCLLHQNPDYPQNLPRWAFLAPYTIFLCVLPENAPPPSPNLPASTCVCCEIAFMQCHCIVCQNWSGAPYQWMVIFPASRATVVKGKSSVTHITTSDTMERGRCKVSWPVSFMARLAWAELENMREGGGGGHVEGEEAGGTRLEECGGFFAYIMQLVHERATTCVEDKKLFSRRTRVAIRVRLAFSRGFSLIPAVVAWPFACAWKRKQKCTVTLPESLRTR